MRESLDLAHEETGHGSLSKFELEPFTRKGIVIPLDGIFKINNVSIERYGMGLVDLVQQNPDQAYHFLRGMTAPADPDRSEGLSSCIDIPTQIILCTFDPSTKPNAPDDASALYEITRFIVEPPNLA